jgi:predicted nucleotidyltransferase
MVQKPELDDFQRTQLTGKAAAHGDDPPSAPAFPEIIRLVSAWCRERPVQLCVLFGSQAKGKSHPYSDVDLAVWPTHPIPSPTRLRWLRELETSLAHQVSLVFVSPDLDPVLGFEIARHGRVLFEAVSGLWATRRAQLWHAFNDSLPFRRAARQRLHEFAEEMRCDS